MSRWHLLDVGDWLYKMSALQNVVSGHVQQLVAQNLPNFGIALVGLIQTLLTAEIVLHDDIVIDTTLKYFIFTI